MSKMRLVFFGTPAFAATVLEELLSGTGTTGVFEVVGVLTRPDAVRSRGKKLVPSEVKLLAQSANLPVFEPTDLRTDEFSDQLCGLAPDVIAVASYGKIIPPEVLDIARLACLNVHASLLPRWRGAAPIERAILAGDTHTGVSIMRVVEALDEGDYCSQDVSLIGEKTADELREELAHKGGVLLGEVLGGLARGHLEWTAQDETKATYAHKLERGELNVHPSDTATWFVRKVRASSRNHPSKMRLAGRGIIVEHAQAVLTDDRVLADERARANGKALADRGAPSVSALAAGEALFVHKRLFLGSADGVVELVSVRPEGKGSMDASAFAQGIQGTKGAILQWGSYE